MPMRIELGPKDLEKGQVCVKMRTGGTGKKEFLDRDAFVAGVKARLDAYQEELFAAAKQRRTDRTVTLDTWDEFVETFKGDSSVFAWCHWDGTTETEAAIKDETKVTIRCIPLPGEGPEPEEGVCIKTGKPSKQRVLMAKAY